MSGKSLVLRSQSKIAQQEQLMRAENLALNKHEKIIQEIREGSLEVSKNKTNLNLLEEVGHLTRSKTVPQLQFPIPEFSSEDATKIRDMIAKHQQRQYKLEQSARELELKALMEEEQLKQKALAEKNRQFQYRKTKVLESIEQIKQRHQSRRRKNIEENKNLTKVKSTTKLYQRLEESWRKVEQKEKQQKQKIKALLHEQKKISFEEIKAHATRHDETMTKFKESWINQSRISQPEKKKFYESIFLSRIVEEDHELQEEYMRKKNLAKQFAEKKHEYADIVRENYKPRVKQASLAPPQIKTAKSLSHFQTFQKGNSYMREVSQKLNIDRTRMGRKSSQVEKSSIELFKYKNYLTERRITKNETQQNEKERQKAYEKEIRRIMRQDGLSQQEKFTKAKLVTKRMESVGQKKNPFKLIESINAKIEILRHVSS